MSEGQHLYDWNRMDVLDLEALRAANSPRAYIFWCDDDCECSQAVIDTLAVRGTNPFHHSWGEFWTGHFYTDGEPGAKLDLQLLHDYLAERDPALFATVTWPEWWPA